MDDHDALHRSRQARDLRKENNEPAAVPGRGAGSGVPLEDAIRRQMEQLFGADFSAVRIHHGDHAPAAGAAAYTQGADIHFAPGRYDPHTASGKEILGHELAHVLQQARGGVGSTGLAGGHALNDDGGLEAEAEQAGARVARGEPVSIGGGATSATAASGGAVIQRVKLMWNASDERWQREKKGDDYSTWRREDTSTMTDPVELWKIGASITETKLANEVWDDYAKLVTQTWQSGEVVMQLDKELRSVRRVTIDHMDSRLRCWLKNDDKKPRPFKTLRQLRPVFPEDPPDGNVTKQTFSPLVERLMVALGATDKTKVGEALELAKPSDALVELIERLSGEHGGKPDTRARSVFIVDGTWDDAVAFCNQHLPQPLKIEGNAEEGNRWGESSFYEAPTILRETSASSDGIAATLEIQIGGHHCEYKWQRTEQERIAEVGRVEHWDPEAPISHVRAVLAGSMIEQGAHGPRGTSRSGGSSGLEETTRFESLEDFLGSERGLQLTPGAIERLRSHAAPETAKLRLANRCFAGSRLETESGVGKQILMEEKQDGYTSVEPVRSYLTKQGEEGTDRLKDLEIEIGRNRLSHRSIGARGDLALISIEKRFWDQFLALDEAQQIERIDEALAPFSPLSGETSRIEVAQQLPYDDRPDQPGEPKSFLEIGEYKFEISSRHGFKFHEQSLESHPGHAGTLKEVELAIVHQALARHLAGALPRSGAVGKMAESPFSVVVGGVRIFYLAWAAAPTAKTIYIPDYMAEDTTKAPTTSQTTPQPSIQIHTDTVEAMASDAGTIDLANGELRALICERVLPRFGHVPRAILAELARRLADAPGMLRDVLVVLHEVAATYVPDLIAELAYRLTPSALAEIAPRLLEGYLETPPIVVEILAVRFLEQAPGKVGALLEQAGLAGHPAAKRFLAL
ncbi:MAG: eCIS core domain-containing protein [Kofleriaceae bacterium]